MDRMDVSTANFDIIRQPGGAYAHFSAAWGEAEQGSGQGGRVGRRRAKRSRCTRCICSLQLRRALEGRRGPYSRSLVFDAAGCTAPVHQHQRVACAARPHPRSPELVISALPAIAADFLPPLLYDGLFVPFPGATLIPVSGTAIHLLQFVLFFHSYFCFPHLVLFRRRTPPPSNLLLGKVAR
jgi:hypothetical protein